MFSSIRWRLVANFVFLTLLTVALVGILALSLMQRYVEGQERDYLMANATAVAQRAVAHLRPIPDQAKLEELARTASFLGNARVRILDDERQVLADSGRESSREQALWIMTAPGLGTPSPYTQLPGSVIVVPSDQMVLDGMAQLDRALEELELRGIVPLPFDAAEDLLRKLPPGSEVFVAERHVSPWGTRFFFGSSRVVDLTVDQNLARSAPTAAASARTPAEVPLRSTRVVSVPIRAGGDALGLVELSKGPDVVAEAVATTRRALLYAGFGTMVLAILVGSLVSNRLTRPLRELTEAATEMSSSDLSIRAPVRRGDEIGQLAGQFNRMAARLEASFSELAAERDVLRRFIADASHELRTPITALRNFNELLQGAAAHDPEARQEFLAESEKQLERLAWITGNLLNLSRIEAGLVALDIAGHDAGDLVRATASAFQPQATERGIDLTLALPEAPLPVRCDRHRVELALSNLLSNALKFTPPGGRIEMGAERSDQMLSLWVADSGAGIAPGDVPHIFDRFYRGQGTDEGASDGRGLGLAIVRGIAQAHGGRVFATSTLGQGSRFTLELPIDPQPARQRPCS